MLTLHHSNHLDILKELLVSLIRREPLTNPLQQEQILVQSPGMARWLQLELAQDFGIAAGITFPLPATFLWDMFVRILGDVPKRSAFAKESMTWKLMGLLPQWQDQPGFEPLKYYLSDDNDLIRRYQLAGKIADLYDQYLVYRPEWIASWEQGDDLPELTQDQPWQPILWRALVERTAQLGQAHWHRANMHFTFADCLARGDFRDKLPKRLFVFGVSALPPGYVQAFHALGQHCDVHLMITNPCRYYWGDIRDARYLARINAKRFKTDNITESSINMNDTGNPLLASLGKLGRDYLYQLQEICAGDSSQEHNPVLEIDAFADIETDSLLHMIQQDILELNDSTGQQRPVASDDHSISFRGCHSPLREAEALHDHLLTLFNNDASLQPKDIIVMVPDIDSFAPYLHAVFGSAQGERYIPFAISDRSASLEHPVLGALHKLLTLDQSRANPPEIIELLEIPAIHRRFNIGSGDISTLSRWVQESGIRWGINQQHQSHFDVPTRDENTWLFGLRRILLGYAMPSNMGLYDDTFPSDQAQGMEAELAGQLAQFIEYCEWLLAALDQPRDSQEWTLFINQILETFFSPDEDDEQVFQQIRNSLNSFREQLTNAEFQERLPRAVMVDWLKENLGNSRSSQRFLAGQVNICTLMPMRSIPFRVVALLGMNDSAYPRSLPPMGFDLMAKAPKKGDRSRRDDDRYLFLEALLSARDKLYISYVSRNVCDNSERFPSVLVSELQNLIQESFVNAPCSPEIDATESNQPLLDRLFHEHTLQPFHPDNFRSQVNYKDNPFQSFAGQWLPAARGEGKAASAFLSTPLPPLAEPEPEQIFELELPLKGFTSFWLNPCEAFCQRRLKIYFDDKDDEIETREPFTLNSLNDWQLKDQLVNGYLQGMDDKQFRQQARAAGLLPHGNFGQLVMNDLQTEARALADLVTPFLIGKQPEQEISLILNNSRLIGWLDNIYSDGLVFWRTGKLKEKFRFQAWIQHLCYCASVDNPGHTHYLTLTESITFSPLNGEAALSQLAYMERLMNEGLTRPLPFFLRTAWAWLKESCNKGLTISDSVDVQAKALKKATDEFEGTDRRDGEKQDAYIQRCWPDLELAMPELQALAQALLLPMYSHMKKLEND